VKGGRKSPGLGFHMVWKNGKRYPVSGTSKHCDVRERTVPEVIWKGGYETANEGGPGIKEGRSLT